MESIRKKLVAKDKKLSDLLNKVIAAEEENPKNEYLGNMETKIKILLSPITETLFAIKRGKPPEDIKKWMKEDKVLLDDSDIPDVKFPSETIKSRKRIEISEKGDINPRGFTNAERKIVNLIDTDIYSEAEIINIMKEIVRGNMKKLSDFPEPENKPKPKPTKGGVRPGAGRKPKAVEVKPKALHIGPKRRGPKPKTTAGQKEIALQKKAEAKIAKKLANRKPYFKADDPPEGFREATPLEAIKDKKVMLYGKIKLDTKLIASMFSTGKSLKDRILDVQMKIAGKMGRLSLLKSKLKLTAGDERVDSSKLQNEFDDLRKEIMLLVDSKKKLESQQ